MSTYRMFGSTHIAESWTVCAPFAHQAIERPESLCQAVKVSTLCLFRAKQLWNLTDVSPKIYNQMQPRWCKANFGMHVKAIHYDDMGVISTSLRNLIWWAHAKLLVFSRGNVRLPPWLLMSSTHCCQGNGVAFALLAEEMFACHHDYWWALQHWCQGRGVAFALAYWCQHCRISTIGYDDMAVVRNSLRDLIWWARAKLLVCGRGTYRLPLWLLMSSATLLPEPGSCIRTCRLVSTV